MAAPVRTFRVPYPRDDDLWSANMQGNTALYWAGPPVNPPPVQVNPGMPASIIWMPDDIDNAAVWSGGGASANMALLNTAAPEANPVMWGCVDDRDAWCGVQQTNMGLLNPSQPSVVPSVNMDMTIAGGVAITISINGVVVVSQ